MKNIALILASGIGKRCNLDMPKQFYKVNGKSIIEHTVNVFHNHEQIDEIIIVTSTEYVSDLRDIFINTTYNKVSKIVEGGLTRKDSSYNGIFSIDDSNVNVLIHDGVRPFVTAEIITSCIKALEKYDAVCVAVDSTDTVYITDDNGVVKDIPVRKNIKRAQTPQCFKLELIKKAHLMAVEDSECIVTDDCGLVMYYNLAPIHTVKGDEHNIKVTFKEDIEYLEKYLK